MAASHTVTRPEAQASRTHDYLYDPLHTLPSERDHARAIFRANTNSQRIKRVPEFKTMFSSLQHYPNHSVQIETTDPVPKFISRSWRGYQDQARNAIMRHAKTNYNSALSLPPKQFPDAKVTGRDRYKFFRRPIIPFITRPSAEVIMQSARLEDSSAESSANRPPTPATRNVMVQTDYRDGEAQTDPYTPEYVVHPGSEPELLTLATLSYGHGLPAGLAEVEMIERARAKRAWEATLPPLSDTENLEKRRKMMQEQENNEWAQREMEIEKLQEARLEVLREMLKKRDDEHADSNNERLHRRWEAQQKIKEKKLQAIKMEHVKMLRKLIRKHRNVEGSFERRDILQDYSQGGSQVYAPLTRIGVFLDRNSKQYEVDSHHLSTYKGLQELEDSLPKYVLQPRVQAPRANSPAKSGFVRRKERRQKDLAEVAKQLEEDKLPKPGRKPLKLLQKVEKPVPRPPTPTVACPPEEDEETELAATFLQKIIRGRAIQNMMLEGKETRQKLIEELRSTHALQQAEQDGKRRTKQHLLQLQRQRRLDKHKESLVNEVLSELEGSSLSEMLDFLSKELVRLQEERRIHAFAMFAERHRRILEAEESGRRQVEERRRREEDEMFRQVVHVHQESVDAYLEEIILNSIERTADEQARKEVEEMAKKINRVAYDMEKNHTQLQREEIIAELVTSFLLPEVQRISLRSKVKESQRSHLFAAHSSIYGKVEEEMNDQTEEDVNVEQIKDEIQE